MKTLSRRDMLAAVAAVVVFVPLAKTLAVITGPRACSICAGPIYRGTRADRAGLPMDTLCLRCLVLELNREPQWPPDLPALAGEIPGLDA
jgi:hypothetical protein